MAMGLEGRRFLVSGGSAGIGAALCAKLVASGAAVAAVARDPARLKESTAKSGARAVVADVGDEEQVRRAVAEAAELLGGLDGLINNAGIGAFGPVASLDRRDFERVLAVNVVGPALLLREALPHLRAAGGGDVVNIASTAGLRGDAGASIYAASKFALRGLSQCWQAELRRENVRVVHVNPSEVQTGFGGRERDEVSPHKLRAEDVADLVHSALVLPSRAMVQEVTLFATNPWLAG